MRRGEELAPISPTREIFPASGPRAAPISMLNSSSRCLRTAAQPVVLEQREIEIEAAAPHALLERART
ncbi:MAG: hypothetical protein DMG00_17810, partial [Acidobacteria bacterium]